MSEKSIGNQVLRPLCRVEGVRGAALMSSEGLLVASKIEGVNAETLAALCTDWMHRMEEEAQKVGLPAMRKLSLRAERGLLFFLRLEEVLLLVVADAEQDPILLWPRVEEAVGKLPRWSEILVAANNESMQPGITQ